MYRADYRYIDASIATNNIYMNKGLLLFPRDCRNTRGGGDADIQSPACNVYRSLGYPRVPFIYNKVREESFFTFRPR